MERVREPTPPPVHAHTHTHPCGNVLAGKTQALPEGAHHTSTAGARAHTDRHTRAVSRTPPPLVGASLGGKPKRCPKAHPILPPPVHAHTHTAAHTHSHTREGQRRLHVFSRWRGLGPRRCPRIFPMVNDTDTVSPAGTDPGPGISYTSSDSWVLRLRRSCELCYFLGPGWHNHNPQADRRRQKATIWAGTAELTGYLRHQGIA